MMYTGDGIGEVKALQPGVLQIDMTSYVKGMIKDFPAKLEGATNRHDKLCQGYDQRFSS